MINITIILSVVTLFFLVLYFIGTKTKNDSILDTFWGVSFLIPLWISFLLNIEFSWYKVTMLVLVNIWGLRLAIHIFTRNKKRGEDKRYIEIKKKFSPKFYNLRRYLQLYLVQQLLMLIIASPYVFIFTFTNATNYVNTLYYVGLAVWIIGFGFESIADMQLKKYIKNRNKNPEIKVLNVGLFKYSRHPNYFGEFLMWVGVFVMSLVFGNIYLIVSPLTIFILLRFVSGVPLNEKHFDSNEQYQQYKKETNAFVPWLKRR